MLSFLLSMGVGLVGSVLTAIVLAADWFIWDLRYRISRQRGPQLDPPGKGRDVIHVPSASGRELIVNCNPSNERSRLFSRLRPSGWTPVGNAEPWSS
jgi:hypothetical protein